MCWDKATFKIKQEPVRDKCDIFQVIVFVSRAINCVFRWKPSMKGKSANNEFNEWDETNWRVSFLFFVLFLEN